MVWKYEKFKGDAAIYAFCPCCNFRHNPSDMEKGENGEWSTVIKYQYNYCPICGEYLRDDKLDTYGAEVIWNDRDIIDLYEEEMKGDYNGRH